MIDPLSPLPVLELGPGTGSVTREILKRGIEPSRLMAVEYSESIRQPFEENSAISCICGFSKVTHLISTAFLPIAGKPVSIPSFPEFRC